MRTPRALTVVAVLLLTALGGTLSSLDVANASSPDGEPTSVIAPGFPLEQTFHLHSKSDALRTIYLDFDGMHVSGTYWNQAFNLPNGDYEGYDSAANGSAFTTAELGEVQEIFQRVAEDYAPFDVDVTTEDPGAAATDRTDANDQAYGVRVLLSRNDSAWQALCDTPDSKCAGISAKIGGYDHYLGRNGDAHSHDFYQPVWVFTHKLSNYPKFIADAVTHEVGHMLGLVHDVTTASPFPYQGRDGWAPVMGAGYYQPIVQFDRSEYSDAQLLNFGEATQANPDDLLTISQHGLGFRADEPGNSLNTAPAAPEGTAYITSQGDVDYWSLGPCSGTVTVDADPAPFGPNLDIELQLLNGSGSVLDVDDPPSARMNALVATGMSATVSMPSLPAGEYYARVDGVGRGTPASGGYSDYGSLGAYTLSVSGCGVPSGPTAPRDLTGSYAGDGVVQLDWSAPASNGGTPITAYRVYEDGVLVAVLDGESLSAKVGPVQSGVHVYTVTAVNGIGEGPTAETTVDATDPTSTTPSRPKNVRAKLGGAGHRTLTIGWEPPVVTGPRITGYQISVYRLNSRNEYRLFGTSPWVGGGVLSVSGTADFPGVYRFAVRARNVFGEGPLSVRSKSIRVR